MKAKHLPTANSGFTIVEVLFVLAIAGFILLLVFQAIPTVQRGARNNERKQDVVSALRGVSQYELSNSGNFPAPCGGLAPNDCGFVGNPANCGNPIICVIPPNFLAYSQKRFTFYDPTSSSDIVLTPQCIVSTITCPARANRGAVSNSQQIDIYNYEKCDTQNQGAAVIAGAGYNDVVAQYALESGSSTPTPQCIQL